MAIKKSPGGACYILRRCMSRNAFPNSTSFVTTRYLLRKCMSRNHQMHDEMENLKRYILRRCMSRNQTGVDPARKIIR